MLSIYSIQYLLFPSSCLSFGLIYLFIYFVLSLYFLLSSLLFCFLPSGDFVRELYSLLQPVTMEFVLFRRGQATIHGTDRSGLLGQFSWFLLSHFWGKTVFVESAIPRVYYRKSSSMLVAQHSRSGTTSLCTVCGSAHVEVFGNRSRQRRCRDSTGNDWLFSSYPMLLMVAVVRQGVVRRWRHCARLCGCWDSTNHRERLIRRDSTHARCGGAAQVRGVSGNSSVHAPMSLPGDYSWHLSLDGCLCTFSCSARSANVHNTPIIHVSVYPGLLRYRRHLLFCDRNCKMYIQKFVRHKKGLAFFRVQICWEIFQPSLEINILGKQCSG